MPRAVILTALSIEYLAVRAHLTELHEEMHPQGTIYERGRFSTDNQVWEVGIAEVGAGNAGAAVEAERAISYFKPDVLLFVGIAGGIKDVSIGDVVAATKVYGYESGKVESQFFTRPKLGQSAYALVQRARSEARKGEWLWRLSSSPSSELRVFVAPIAAGEKVVASKESDLFQFLRSSYNDAVAVEMEGFGFLSAVFAYPNIKAIVIRGISDLIEDKNLDAPESGQEPEQVRQEKASRHASAFAFELLAKLQTQPSQQPASSEPGAESSIVQHKTAPKLGEVKVFFSYAHEDEQLRDKLATHLSSLRRQGIIQEWHDRQIGAGQERASEIDRNLEAAHVILLLISADFISSDYRMDRELSRAMERHELGEARVIPIILRPVDWEGLPFSKLQALPTDGNPVTSWSDQDEALLNVARGIRSVVEGMAEDALGTEANSQADLESTSPLREGKQLFQEKPQAPVKLSNSKDKLNLFDYVPTHPTKSLAYFVDCSQAFRLMPFDLGTIWGLQRSRFIGLLIGVEPTELYENLKKVEFILGEAIKENQAVHELAAMLPRREWIQLDADVDFDSAIVNSLENKAFSDTTLLGFYYKVNLEQLNIDGLRRLQKLCHTLLEQLSPDQPVAVVIHIIHPVNQFLMQAVDPMVETLKNQLRKITPDTPIELLRSKANLSMLRNPLDNGQLIGDLSMIHNSRTDIPLNKGPDIKDRTGLLFCSWIYYLSIDERRTHEEIVDLYLKLRKSYSEQELQGVYHQITARDVVSDLSNLQSHLRTVYPEAVVLERMKTIYEQLLKLSISSFPHQSYEWIRAYAESANVERISATLNVLTNPEFHVISDILLDIWVNELNYESLSIDCLRQALFWYQSFETESDLKLEGLFLAFLRIKQVSVTNQSNQKLHSILDELMRSSPILQKFYDFYQNPHEKEGEFLYQNDPHRFIFAIRTNVKFKSAMEYFKASPASNLPVPLCWLLSTIAPSRGSIKELLQLTAQKRAVFGLCTLEEWRQIQKRPEKENQILDCRRKRNLVFSSNSL